MTSPFFPYANAELTFDVVTGIKSKPESMESTVLSAKVKVTAVLKSARITRQELEGVDQSWEAMEGFYVEPLSPPKGLTSGTKGTVRFAVSEGIYRDGVVRFQPVIQNSFVQSTGLQIINKIRVLIQWSDI